MKKPENPEGIEAWEKYNEVFWFVHRKNSVMRRLIRMAKSRSHELPAHFQDILEQVRKMTDDVFFKLDDVLQNGQD